MKAIQEHTTVPVVSSAVLVPGACLCGLSFLSAQRGGGVDESVAVADVVAG